MECEYCKIIVKTKYILKTHLVNNKACLKLRGLTMESKFTCKGCTTSFMNNTNLMIHFDSCKKYILLKVQEDHQQEIEKLIEEYQKEIEKNKEKHTKKIEKVQEEHTKKIEKVQEEHQKEIEKNKEEYHKEIETYKKNNNEQQFKLNEQEKTIKNLQHESKDYDTLKIDHKILKEKYEDLKNQYEKTISKLEQKISQCDSFIQTLAREGSNKPTTKTNNKINNTIINALSTDYTLEKLEQKQLEETMRQHYTERDFFNGQKGLANFCLERIIKAPDGKMLICCSDISRKKFKILDVNGNLKEDIEARLLCQKLKIPIQNITKEIYDKIQDKIDQERSRLSDNDSSRREKLLDDSMRAQKVYIDNMNFDDLNYNQDFMHELCVLLNI